MYDMKSAQFAYGFPFDEKKYDSDGNYIYPRDNWREIASELGVTACRRGPQDDYDYNENMNYGFICIKESNAEVEEYQTIQIESLAVDPSWDEKLKNFCDRTNFPWKQPAWYLWAYCGNALD